MRIGIIGAGAVGGTLAALLDRAGHDVAVTARGEHLAAVRADGLRLDGGWGEHTARVAATEVLGSHAPLGDAAPLELAILATKAQDGAAALAANRSAVSGAPLLVVQNGIGGLRVARDVLPPAPLFGGLALFAASYLSPGRVTVTAPLPLVVGAAEGTPAAELDAVVGVLAAALPVERVADLAGAQWSKLLVNHVNALPAITGLSVQKVVADPGLRRVMTASMRETVRIAERLGIPFAGLQGVPGSALRLVGHAPLGVGALFPRMLARRMGDVPNPGSTLQSIRRGQPTEIDFLNGAVVDAARAAGVDAPINASLVALVHEVEASGHFVPVAEVLRRIRL